MNAGASARTFPTWLSTCAIWLLSSVGYIVVAWFELVRPIAGQWSDALLGTSLFRPDPILNAGILEWGYQAIRTAPLRFFDWPAGFPIVNSLAGTENLIGWQLFYTPLRLLGVGNVAAVNTLLVAAVVLSAMTMMLLARQLGLNPWAAFVAGLVFAFVPFHISQLIQIQSLSIAWVPLTLVFLERALGRPTLPPLLGLTLSIVMTVLSGMYIGIFLLLVLSLYVGTALLVRHRHIGRTTLLRIVASLALALVLVSPMVFVYARFAATEGGYYHAASQMVGEALADFLRPA